MSTSLKNFGAGFGCRTYSRGKEEEGRNTRQQPGFLLQKETIPSLFASQADLAGFLRLLPEKEDPPVSSSLPLFLPKEEEDAGMIPVSVEPCPMNKGEWKF
ncbi:hypothetical protein MRB53_013575 [Persea americana]|uniref:Uncharacterized protein n=1 Tax=Persea americana TaxID=3435 RepID=A0ACC2K8E5_PERAE|nr:hypothetical protein MRB53_013575 [Persea americana]